MKKVQILLSTYNGGKYLKEQLDSILNQDYSNVTILIRDDGSTDDTVKILEKYANEYSQLSFYCGINIGVIGSFFDLIKNADMSAHYYSLSDQDDIWKPSKISRAVDILNTISQEIQDKALLYCGRTTLVNSNLDPIKTTIKKNSVLPSFGNALVENICTGCTSVFNKELLLLVQNHIPNFTIMHDWWIYLTASSFGEVYYDNESYILYRQHVDNVIGTRATYFEEFKARIKNYKSNRGMISRQVAEFDSIYQSNDVNQQMINSIINAKKNVLHRLQIVASNRIYRQRKMDNMIFKFLFLNGKV